MGRRKQYDESERRTEQITMKVTPTERTMLDARAEAAGLRLSDYARAALFGYRVNVRDPLSEKALFELSAIGNNINQLAKHANTTGRIDADKALENTLLVLCEAVGRLHE